MSEKPHEARVGGQEDLLEHIIAQGLEKMKAPAQATAAAEAAADEMPSFPRQADSGETESPANRKNKRSAVYLYLLILFGAAFLMLLLAYFIQQRSSESTISDLRDSMNLSREELLDEIKALEEEKDALYVKFYQLQRELAQWQERYEEKAQEATHLRDLIITAQEELYAWTSFWTLEQYYQTEDYTSCAAILLEMEMAGFGDFIPVSASAQARREEIVQAVINAGILDEEYKQHPEDYRDLLDAYYFDKIGIITVSAQWTGQWIE